MKEYGIRFIVCALGLLSYVAANARPALCQSTTATRVPLTYYPTQYLDSPPDAPAGEIAYLLRLKILSPTIKNFPLDLVIQKTGKGAAPSQKAVYPITSTQGYPYANAFSPSGKGLLVETTFPSFSEDAYQLQFWNAAAARIQVGPTLIGYPEVRWSPDSQFMAYFQGGDVFGEESRGATALQLHVYNLQTGKSQLIVKNPEAKSFCWTHQHTLLYTFKSLSLQKTAYEYYLKKPNIYEAALRGNSAHLLIPEGYDPVASPDGQWVAFKGWSKPALKNGANTAAGQEQFGLYLYDRRKKKRILLHVLPQEKASENLLWSADSAHLYSVRNIYTDTHPAMRDSTDKTIYPGSGKGYVSDISVPALTQRDIATISASDSVGRSDPQNQMLFHSVSKDGKFLYLSVEEFRQQYFHTRLLSINIQSGASQTILEGVGIQGIGWQPR